MGTRRLIRSDAALALVLAGALACTDDPLPASPEPTADAGGVILCDEETKCPDGLSCIAGICQTPPDAGVDAGALEARLQICAPEGCDDPLLLSFGGSRVGETVERRFTARSIGSAPVVIRSVSLVDPSTEFEVEPTGTLEQTLAPGEERTFRVRHTALDGQPDDIRLELLTTETDAAKRVVRLVTEYKGIPDLHVGSEPASTQMPLTLLDFGMVRAGVPEQRVIYLKNADRVIDGSIIEVSELSTLPMTSEHFALQTDPVPALLNQFRATCATDADCYEATDRCLTGIGVCARADGTLRDVLTATVTYVGARPGVIEEELIITSNDGGTPGAVSRVAIRANATYSEVDVSPDPIDFGEGYIGFPETLSVTVSNDGDASLELASVYLVETSTFSLELGALALPASVPGGGSVTFTVRYDPRGPSPEQTELVIESNDLSTPTRRVTVQGTPFEAPELQLSSRAVDFGDTHVAVGTAPSATHTLTLRNTGGSELRIPSLALSSTTSSDFSFAPSSLPNLPAGGQAEVELRYSPAFPTHPTAQTGRLDVVSNDPRWQPRASVSLRGVGINPNAQVSVDGGVVGATSINFNQLRSNPNAPSIYYAQTLSAQVTVANAGLGPLTVTQLSLLSDARGAFSITGAPSTPFSIPASSNRSFTVSYAAPSPGTDGASLRIGTNDLDLPGGLINLSLVADTDDCPSLSNASGQATAAGQCQYTCRMGWVDFDGDLGRAGSNGCEYACTFQSATDVPDDNFVDANCDGIDGDVNAAIFVAPPPLGSDANTGALGSPMASLTAAITRASNTGLAVYVGAGDYAGPITLVAGVSVYGGYEPTNRWQRSTSARSRIQSSTGRGVLAHGITQPTVFDRMVVNPGNAAAPSSGPGESSIGIDVLGSSSALRISNTIIVAGNGSRGSNGANGSTGASGGNASAGQVGYDGSCPSNRGAGGAGGNSTCGAPGGGGGRGGCDNNPGGGGSTGIGPGGGGGGGGRGAVTCNAGACSTCRGPKGGASGSSGSHGSTGSAGAHGSGGSANGSMVGDTWTGARGSSGAVGSSGGGGGGGGAGGGGADDCYVRVFACFSQPIDCNFDLGGGGGGGGAGGCGGRGGTGGYGGGGSFGIFVRRSSPVLVNNEITAGIGGRGGNGGNYGSGGSGGAGGIGGAGQDDSGTGGRGGNGGRGGRGGSGGGGGGGVSYCIYRSLSPSTQLTGNSCVLGRGGYAGSGGTSNGGGAGALGASGTTY